MGQTTPSALNPAELSAAGVDLDLPVGSSTATAVTDSINLPAVMSVGDEDTALAPAPPTAEVSTAQETTEVTKQENADVAVTVSDLPAATISSLPPSAASRSPTPDALPENSSAPYPTPSPAPQSGNSRAPGSTRPVTPDAPLPVLATATRRPPDAPAAPTASRAAGSAPVHFADCAARSEGNATIAIPLEMALSGMLLESGDEIAVFNPDGTFCAGSVVWTGQNTAVTAWGDDSQTAEVDGLRAGELLHYRIWDVSQAREYVAASITYSTGDGIFFADSIHVVAAMMVEEP